MITGIIGALVGSKLDQQDGDSGAKGAVIGYCPSSKHLAQMGSWISGERASSGA